MEGANMYSMIKTCLSSVFSFFLLFELLHPLFAGALLLPLKGGELDRILSREDIWGYNVVKSPLYGAVVAAFESMNRGAGAVRATLHKTVEG